MSSSLFGTDGIRASADGAPLDDDTLVRLGRALAGAVADGGPLADATAGEAAVTIVMGRDTRLSGRRIRDALATGVLESGACARDLGVLPSPALAILAAEQGAALGVMISASHNPPADNGIKLFLPDARKLPPEVEQWIESSMAGQAVGRSAPTVVAEKLEDDPAASDRYVARLVAAFTGRLDLTGETVVFDGANGAASAIGPKVLEQLGARVVPVACDGDGARINVDCGATCVESILQAVGAQQARYGITVDGDADRVLLVDETGQLRDGDDMLWVLARSWWGGGDEPLQGASASDPRGVVSTVMSNWGFEQALGRLGLELVRTDVGDRNVATAMSERGLPFGGEPSGHLIIRDHAPTGDGLHTALAVLAAVRDSGSTLAEICASLEKSPQQLVNVMVRERPPIESVEGVPEAIERAEAELGRHGGGRVLVRYSGTEPKARVLVEGADAAVVQREADGIASVLRRELGV